MEKITHGNAVLVNGPTGHKWVSKSKARALCEPPKDPKTGKPVKDKEPFVSPWTYVMGEPPKQAAEPVTVPETAMKTAPSGFDRAGEDRGYRREGIGPWRRRS